MACSQLKFYWVLNASYIISPGSEYKLPKYKLIDDCVYVYINA